MAIISKQSSESRGESKVLLIRQSEDLEINVLAPYKSILAKKMQDSDNGTYVFYTDQGPLIVVRLKTQPEEAKTGDILEESRSKGGHICKRLNAEKIQSADLQRVSSTITKDELIAFAEGMALANYQFLKYKSDKKPNTLTNIFIDDTNVDGVELDELNIIVAANRMARDLGNEPVTGLNAVQLAEFVQQMCAATGMTSEIMHKAQIQSLRMGGLLGVNAGSSVPPTFSILEHKPANCVNSKPLVFIGKGVTYDTGGYSLKVGGSMPGMKMDMSGAAAVIGAMFAIAKNNLPIHCVGLIPATDNRVNSDALVPDDVITMHDGTTVEVLNTDAEGRLILADALSYAKKYDPMLVIDLATLTGAAAVITGALGSAMMGTDTNYKSLLQDAGNITYERLWEIPYWKEYADMLKSDVADLKNIGGAIGGSATAGKFLEHFTDYPWLHLDIAGPAILKDEEAYKFKGASGVGVRLLYAFARKLVKA